MLITILSCLSHTLPVSPTILFLAWCEQFAMFARPTLYGHVVRDGLANQTSFLDRLGLNS